MKKVQSKYAEQSHEERELARRLLGGRSGPGGLVKPGTDKGQVIEKTAAGVEQGGKNARQEITKGEGSPVIAPIFRPPKPIDEPLEVHSPPSPSTLFKLNLLTHKQPLPLSLKDLISPQPGDFLTDALCICAPWSALTRYKYKIKLTPGAMKKGKVARGIIAGFIAWRPEGQGQEPGEEQELLQRERELLKSLRGILILFHLFPATPPPRIQPGYKQVFVLWLFCPRGCIPADCLLRIVLGMSEVNGR